MKKNNEKGMALLSAIIIIALLAIMSATILQLSYLSYSRKVVERRTTDTYYTAESCIDTIKAVVQNKVSAAVIEAKNGTDKFVAAAYDALQPSNLGGATLEEYLYNQIVYENGIVDEDHKKNDYEYNHGYMDEENSTTIYDGLGGASKSGFSIGTVEKGTDKLTITNVTIKFTNNLGYTAEITTDIVINAPVYIEVDDAPIASYSMFAGSGCYIKGKAQYGTHSPEQADNAVYVHQEGNVYFGYGNDYSMYDADIQYGASLYLDALGQGGTFFSVSGTNCIFNGDVFVTNGSSLMFTGGDGKTKANIRVNGNIYLSNGASLLMANNVRLECAGIKVYNGADKHPMKKQYTDYTGEGIDTGKLEKSLSQFYPVSSSYAMASSQYDNYMNAPVLTATDIVEATADVEQVIAARKDTLPNGSSNLDTRVYSVGDNDDHNNYCGVYLRSGKSNASIGWLHNASDAYYVLKKVGNVWRTEGETNFYKDNIFADPDDPNFEAVTKDPVQYNGVDVDYEFAKIVNLPICDLFNYDTNQFLGKRFLAGYSTSNTSAYDATTTFGGTGASSLKTKLTTLNVDSQIVNAIDWTAIENGLHDLSNNLNVEMKSRTFRVPKADTLSWSAENAETLPDITDVDGNVYKPKQTSVGISQGDRLVVSSSDTRAYFIAVCENDIELHLGKDYAGFFLSGKSLKISDGVGLARGISLLELANNTANAGLKNTSNPVRIMLEKLSSSAMANIGNVEKLNCNGSVLNSMGSKVTERGYSAIYLFDNLFNGGVKSFWGDAKNSGDGENGSDNSNVDFVDVDNYQKK